ncbi:MAG: hypothetical protein LRY54_00495, partial [Alphaproteobacteria bacterium]|nr:hypothetical protein [Alphaproteobacteria bacterium]
MTSKSLRRALLAATILAYPVPLYAQAPSSSKAESTAAMEILSPSSNWKVESGRIDLPQGGAVPYCAISNTYRENGRLEFYGTSGSLAAIKADIPGQSFSDGDVLDVSLKMPGGYNSATKASVAGTSTLILNVKGDEALMAALYNGTLLYVGVGGRDYPFSLSGINNFGERIRTCSQSARTQNFVAMPSPDIQVREQAPVAAPAPVLQEAPVVQAAAEPQEDVAVSVQKKEESPAQLSLPFSQESVMAPPVSESASDKAKEQAARELAEQKLAEKERELAVARDRHEDPGREGGFHLLRERCLCTGDRAGDAIPARPASAYHDRSPMACSGDCWS